MVVPNLNVSGVPASTPIESCQLERGLNQGMERIPILDMKKVDTVAENMCLKISLDPEALPRM